MSKSKQQVLAAAAQLCCCDEDYNCQKIYCSAINEITNSTQTSKTQWCAACDVEMPKMCE